MTNKRSMLYAALLAGGGVLAVSAAYAQPDNNPKPASPPPSHDMHGPVMHHPWHPADHAWHGPVFRFHDRDFHHFTPQEHAMWLRGSWGHRWWHGHWAWFWLTGGGAYFYPAPVYPYPGYVSETVVDEGPDTDEGPAYNSGPQGGSGGTWYYCPSPKGYYPYVPQCSSQWQPVPATPPDMQGGPNGGPGDMDNGPQGGQDEDMGPPPDDRGTGAGNGHGPDDQMGPPNGGPDDRDMGPDNGPPDESGPPADEPPPDDNNNGGYPPDNGPPR